MLYHAKMYSQAEVKLSDTKYFVESKANLKFS